MTGRVKPGDDFFDDADYLTSYDLERESLNDSEPANDEVESQFFGVQTICQLCGHVYMPWPGHERCPNCGARVKR